MHQTTYLATLTDETPEQKLIHFTFKNLSLLQDAINQAVCTLFFYSRNQVEHFKSILQRMLLWFLCFPW